MPSLSPEYIATLLGIGIAIGWIVRYLFPQLLGTKDSGNGNTKITVALLAQEMNHLKEELKAGMARIEKKIDQLAEDAVSEGLCQARVKSLMDKIDRMEGKNVYRNP